MSDYMLGADSTSVSFSTDSIDDRECITVEAPADAVKEGLETFSLMLASPESPLTIFGGYNTTQITIIDSDGMSVWIVIKYAVEPLPLL